MKNSVYLISFCLLLLAACKTPVAEEKEMSSAEKMHLDSLSKMRQKVVADSMKRINPLLIMPPDSNYTGEYTDRYPTGIVKFKGFFRFGKRHGQWVSFFPNGLMWSELHFDNGLRHGPNITFFESGNMRYTGYYKNDRQDSVWSYFDSTGKLAQKVLYKNDRIVKNLPLK